MPEPYEIRFTTRASDDLTSICSYIERDSAQNAASVARRLIEAIDSLVSLPHRYRIHEHRRDPAKTVHAMPVPPFIVYYRVLDRRLTVEIVAVRHGRRRQPQRFREQTS